MKKADVKKVTVKPRVLVGSAALKAVVDPNWNAVKVKLGNGYTYLVTRVAIENDYAATVAELDGVTMGVALEKARSQDVLSWFREQYGVNDVVEQGVILQRPTYEQAMELALNASAELVIETSQELTLV